MDCPSTMSSDIHLHATFQSFAEFHQNLHGWMAANSLPFRVASSERLRDYTGEMNDLCRYRYIVYHCVHYGQPRKRGTGKRPNQLYKARGCTATLRLNYSYAEKCLKITTFKNEHIGHDVSEDAYNDFMSKVKTEVTPATSKAIKRRASSPGEENTPKSRGPRPKKMKKEELKEEPDSSSAHETPTPDGAPTASTDDKEYIDVVTSDDWHPAPPPNLPAPVPQLPADNPHFMPFLMQPYLFPYSFYNFGGYGQNMGLMQPAEAQIATGSNEAPIGTLVGESDNENKENVQPTGAQQYEAQQSVINTSTASYPSSIQNTISSLQMQLMNPNLGAERQVELQSLLDKWGTM